MLRGFERFAAGQDPRDAEVFLLKVSQQMTDSLMAALSDRSVHIARAAADEAAKMGISLIPAIGPFVAGGITAGELVAEKLRETRSGIAALMKLRGE